MAGRFPRAGSGLAELRGIAWLWLQSETIKSRRGRTRQPFCFGNRQIQESKLRLSKKHL